MALNQSLITELQHEAEATRKVLELVPFDKSDWKPNEKSMTLGRLATHLAEILGWISRTLNTDEMDFAKFEYDQKIASSTAELLDIFERNYSEGMKSLLNAKDEDFLSDWTMRNGEHIYFTLPRIAVIRTFAFNHLYHHRGQMSVFLSLQNIPLSYFYRPTTEEK